MKPEARVWRKAQRAARKGARRGRRSTHLVRIDPPRRGSTWLNRHPGPDALTYYLENAR